MRSPEKREQEHFERRVAVDPGDRRRGRHCRRRALLAHHHGAVAPEALQVLLGDIHPGVDHHPCAI